MTDPGVPAPGFMKRIGAVVDKRRGMEFQDAQVGEAPESPDGRDDAVRVDREPVPGLRDGLPLLLCAARRTSIWGMPTRSSSRERIYVKQAGPSRLLRGLMRARDSGQEVAIGAATDPYQPAEARFAVTRQRPRGHGPRARSPGRASPRSPRASCATSSFSGDRAAARTSGSTSRSSRWTPRSCGSIEPRAPRPDLRLEAMRALSPTAGSARASSSCRCCPCSPTASAGSARASGRRPRGGRARGDLRRRSSCARAIAVAFLPRLREARVSRGRSPRYRALYPAARQRRRAAYREGIERLVQRLAAEVGFPARSRDDRVRAERPRVRASSRWSGKRPLGLVEGLPCRAARARRPRRRARGRPAR